MTCSALDWKHRRFETFHRLSIISGDALCVRRQLVTSTPVGGEGSTTRDPSSRGDAAVIVPPPSRLIARMAPMGSREAGPAECGDAAERREGRWA